MIKRIAAVFLAAVGIAVVQAVPAQARYCAMNHWCTTHWYSDASLTTVVGGLYVECDAYAFRWGTQTSHVTFEEHAC